LGRLGRSVVGGVVVSPVAAGLSAGDGEVLADLDGELVARGGGDVGFVDAAVVGLAALDGGSGVGGQDSVLDLGLGVSGQRFLALPAPTVVSTAAWAAANALTVSPRGRIKDEVIQAYRTAGN
jgi:hypothetical protein